MSDGLQSTTYPSEIARSPGWDDVALRCALEEDGLGPGTRTVAKGTQRGRFGRREALKHGVETFETSVRSTDKSMVSYLVAAQKHEAVKRSIRAALGTSGR